MTLRRGLRNDISRYEAITVALVEPKGPNVGGLVSSFPPPDSPLHIDKFFGTLYRRYEERFVYAASLLVKRGITPRMEWRQIPQSLSQNRPVQRIGYYTIMSLVDVPHRRDDLSSVSKRATILPRPPRLPSH
jgi:hypothetical protein